MKKLADISVFERLQGQANAGFIPDMTVFNGGASKSPIADEVLEWVEYDPFAEFFCSLEELPERSEEDMLHWMKKKLSFGMWDDVWRVWGVNDPKVVADVKSAVRDEATALVNGISKIYPFSSKSGAIEELCGLVWDSFKRNAMWNVYPSSFPDEYGGVALGDMYNIPSDLPQEEIYRRMEEASKDYEANYKHAEGWD